LNYNWTGPAKELRLSIADILWSPSGSMEVLFSRCLHHGLCKRCSQPCLSSPADTSEGVAVAQPCWFSWLIRTYSHLRFTLRTAQRFQGYLSRLRARKLASPSLPVRRLGYQQFLPCLSPVNPDRGFQWLRIGSASLGIGFLPEVVHTPPYPLKACDGSYSQA
jgi:hypothetical protein